MSKFEDIVPGAKRQANMAIASLDNIASDVFSFADMEILDANLAMTPRGLPHMDYSQAAIARTRYLHFTITVSPVEQDNISSEVVRNEVEVQEKTDANATEPVKVTYTDAVKGKTESEQVKRVKFVSPLTLKI